MIGNGQIARTVPWENGRLGFRSGYAIRKGIFRNVQAIGAVDPRECLIS